MDKTIGKNMSKSLDGKYNHNLFDHPNQPAKYALKTTSNKVIQKVAEGSGALIGRVVSNFSFQIV